MYKQTANDAHTHTHTHAINFVFGLFGIYDHPIVWMNVKTQWVSLNYRRKRVSRGTNDDIMW